MYLFCRGAAEKSIVNFSPSLILDIILISLHPRVHVQASDYLLTNNSALITKNRHPGIFEHRRIVVELKFIEFNLMMIALFQSSAGVQPICLNKRY